MFLVNTVQLLFLICARTIPKFSIAQCCFKKLCAIATIALTASIDEVPIDNKWNDSMTQTRSGDSNNFFAVELRMIGISWPRRIPFFVKFIVVTRFVNKINNTCPEPLVALVHTVFLPLYFFAGLVI